MHLVYYKTHLFSPAIFRASRNGNAARLQQLIDNGANVNNHDRDGLTPLMVAALRGESTAVKILVGHGADVNARNKFGHTPLMFASMNTKKWLYAIKKYWNDITISHTMTVDGQINFSKYYPPYNDKYTDIANTLILNGADVNVVSSYSMTPLMYAAFSGNEKMTELLLSKGAHVDARNKDGATPLMLAIMRGFASVVKILIEYGADVNAAGDDGITAMTIASYKKNEEILKLLRDKGVEGEITNCCSRGK